MTAQLRTCSLFLCSLLGIVAGCDSNKPAPPSSTSADVSAIADAPAEMRRFCGDCHTFPSPSTFPKDAWYKEVQRGFDFYTNSQRSDMTPPAMNDVVSWYRANSSPTLPETPRIAPAAGPVDFEKAEIFCQAAGDAMVSSVTWIPRNDDPPQLLLTDMSSGHVCEVLTKPAVTTRDITITSNPACCKLIDLDTDGILDLLIADLGSQEPADHDKGSVVFLSECDGENEAIKLLDGVGRVADVDTADFDRDGDIDIVVAEFGWHKTGGILLLENTAKDSADIGRDINKSGFVVHKIDSRHGAIHVPVSDLNSDGIPDFVALISQEFETVEVFLGNGDLTFRKEVILPPQDPSFGSCGIELTDIDHDGDTDVVYCNGDTLDGFVVKHYHGVHLLLNEGAFPFRDNKILSLPGASDTATADFDGDGDLDVAVSGFLPPQLSENLPTREFDSLCWLEQTQPQVFTPHLIERSSVGHLTITAGDFNGDAATDIAVGNYPGQDWGAIWWNLKANAKK